MGKRTFKSNMTKQSLILKVVEGVELPDRITMKLSLEDDGSVKEYLSNDGTPRALLSNDSSTAFAYVSGEKLETLDFDDDGLTVLDIIHFKDPSKVEATRKFSLGGGK